jgi:hypothetical protein
MVADTVVHWLADGDPSVRWQVLRDLLDEPADVVAAERARVATHGWGARLLAEQAPDGTWDGGLYSPKWTSTTYTLLLLAHLGLPAGHPQAVAGCRRLLDGARWIGGGLTFGRGQAVPETCITALVIGIAAAFDAVDERVTGALDWLLDQQLPDGGWNCASLRTGSTHGSFNTTILALEALEALEALAALTAMESREGRPARRPHPDERWQRAAGRGRGFFLDHRLYCSHRTGEVVSAVYTRPVFPPGWHHDLLRGLEHFRQAGAAPDDRLRGAVDLLRARRRPDGTWRAYRPHPGRYWFELEAPGRPSRIATLRSLRVLRWWQGGRRGRRAEG